MPYACVPEVEMFPFPQNGDGNALSGSRTAKYVHTKDNALHTNALFRRNGTFPPLFFLSCGAAGRYFARKRGHFSASILIFVHSNPEPSIFRNPESSLSFMVKKNRKR